MAIFSRGGNKYKMKGIFLIILLLSLLIISIVFVTSRDKKGEEAGLIRIIETAEQLGNDAKIRKIKAAESLYIIETGKRPQNIDDLLKGGYIEPHDTLDHKGNKLNYSPGSMEPLLSDTGTGIVKTCSKCNNKVSADSRPGDECPHCSAIWSFEKKN